MVDAVLDNLTPDVGRGGSHLQFPTAEVNSEMRLPHGSDWPSIREAGRKPGNTPSPMGCPGSRLTMGSESERTLCAAVARSRTHV